MKNIFFWLGSVLVVFLVFGFIGPLRLIDPEADDALLVRTNADVVEVDQPTFDESVCWNQVEKVGEQHFWPNDCNGSLDQSYCGRRPVALDQYEKYQYDAWLEAGQPEIEGC